jgi:hypothetical protein
MIPARIAFRTTGNFSSGIGEGLLFGSGPIATCANGQSAATHAEGRASHMRSKTRRRASQAFSAVVAAERTLNRALFALALAPAKGFVSLLYDLGDRRHTS